MVQPEAHTHPPQPTITAATGEGGGGTEDTTTTAVTTTTTTTTTLAQPTAVAATGGGGGTEDTTTTTTITTTATTPTTTSSTKLTASNPPSPAPKPKPHKVYAYLFKYVIIGDSGVGKTALVKRFCKDYFLESHIITIGIDFDIKTIDLPNGDGVKLQMWDTAGQERYRDISTSYYRGTNGVLVVYDLTDKESFDHVPNWVHEAQVLCNDEAIIVVVGTKKDIADNTDKEVYGRDKVRQLLQDRGMMGSKEEEISPSGNRAKVFGLYEVSAKTGEGVEESFRDLTDKLVTRKLNQRNPLRARHHGKMASIEYETIRLGESEKKPKSRYC